MTIILIIQYHIYSTPGSRLHSIIIIIYECYYYYCPKILPGPSSSYSFPGKFLATQECIIAQPPVRSANHDPISLAPGVSMVHWKLGPYNYLKTNKHILKDILICQKKT